MTNYFRLLGVFPDSSEEEIELAWRTMRRALHPDAGGDADHFAKVSEAASVLRDPKERSRYIAKLNATRHVCTNCDGKGRVSKQISFSARSKPLACAACGGEGYHAR